VTFLRLCWRAPVMMMRSSSIGLRGPEAPHPRGEPSILLAGFAALQAPRPRGRAAERASSPWRASGPLESPKAGQTGQEEVSWHRDPGASFSSCCPLALWRGPRPGRQPRPLPRRNRPSRDLRDDGVLRDQPPEEKVLARLREPVRAGPGHAARGQRAAGSVISVRRSGKVKGRASPVPRLHPAHRERQDLRPADPPHQACSPGDPRQGRQDHRRRARARARWWGRSRTASPGAAKGASWAAERARAWSWPTRGQGSLDPRGLALAACGWSVRSSWTDPGPARRSARERLTPA
jgi:hypothetical protein